MRTLLRSLAASLALAIAFAPAAPAQHGHDLPPGHAPIQAQRTAPWPEDVVALFERLPLQDGGRVKPMHTYAGFTLLRMNGKRSVALENGEKLTPVEWLLDVLFFPAQANAYEIFQVQDVAAVREIGAPTEGKKKRDRYSFDELRGSIAPLFEKAREYASIEEKDRSSVQQQVFLLAQNVDDYIRLITYADFGRHPLPIGQGAGLEKIFGGQEEAALSQVLAKAGELRQLQREVAGDPTRAAEGEALTALLQGTAELASGTETLALLPPAGSVVEEPEWLAPSDVMMQAFSGVPVAPAHLEMLQAFEGLAAAPANAGAFAEKLGTLAGHARDLATARGEYEKVGLELVYYKSKLISYALVFFMFAFLMTAVVWLRPKSRWLYWLASLCVAVPIVLLVGAIVLRCLIRERPPVSTLYETVLFVTAGGALTALVVEWITRAKIALSAAATLGVVFLFIANGYEMLDKRDTMPQLVAVLDTNFWLATHVTAITFGYAAGLVAALFANIYLVAGIFGAVRRSPKAMKTLATMGYGTLCFALIFSVVGTILGGIWANESWGRFWGWDPKENGALLICLSQLVILHARMGGYIKDFGVAMATAFGGTVIGFSWWGVNLLGVGLHSYGFTSGIHSALWSYYIAQWGLMAVAFVFYMIERARSAAVREALAQGVRASLSPDAAQGGAR